MFAKPSTVSVARRFQLGLSLSVRGAASALEESYQIRKKN